MRTLLVAEHLEPSLGGGYTLSRDLLHALVNYSKPTDHKFFLLRQHCNLELPDKKASHMEIVDAPLIRGEPPLMQRLLNWASRFSSRFHSGAAAEKRLNRFIRQISRLHHIDCALNLVPFQNIDFLPNILTVWDLEHRRRSHFPEVSMHGVWEQREAIYKAILPRAMAIVTGTQTTKTSIVEGYGVDRSIVHVLPFPTPDFALNANGQSTRCRLIPNTEYIFYPAQFWGHKNHTTLLTTLKILREQYGWNGQLVFCGSDYGNLAHVKQVAANMGIGDYVTFLGFVSRDDVTSLYRDALATTYVSYFGPDNLPPLEACALGCPVVASDLPGWREFLGDAALYASPASGAEIANAVWRIKAQSSVRKDLIQAGLKRAARTSETYWNEMFQLLDSFEAQFQCFRTA